MSQRGRGRSTRRSGRSGSIGRSRGGGRGRSESIERKCYNCQEPGHFAMDCTQPAKCYECQGRGHRSFDCPLRKKTKTPTSSTKTEGGHGSNYNVELVELPLEEKKVGEANLASKARSTWIVDSGCTQHMCNQSEFFTKA